MLLSLLKYAATNVYVIAASFVAVTTLSFIAYYRYTSYKIDNLTRTVVELESSVAQKSAYIESLKVDYAKILKSRSDIEDLNRKYEKSITSLRDKLNREASGKMGITELAIKKPSLVEKYVNKEIKRQLDCIKNINVDNEC